MFSWTKEEKDNSLEYHFLRASSVNQITVSSAFLSKKGIDLLRAAQEKYRLPPTRIRLFLSTGFSVDSPADMLTELQSISTVFIVHERTLHAKVYWLEGPENILIFGSSNFTMGGFENNLEFNSIIVPTDEENNRIAAFFHVCHHHATQVNDSIISYYREKEATFAELASVERQAKKALRWPTHATDAFEEDDYDLSKAYFSYTDYETLFARNQSRDDAEVNRRRKGIQDKIMQIHNQIYPTIKKLGIFCHWNKNHITSLIRPEKYNNHKVAWVGVRYGKSKQEFDSIRSYMRDGDEGVGFQKHGCLQFSIIPDGFEVNLFLAVRHDAWDRGYLHENIVRLSPAIERELYELQGNGMQWVISKYLASDNDDGREDRVFDIDNSDPADFRKFFLSYDGDGYESYLMKKYNPDANEIRSISSICDEVIRTIKKLLPLYNTIVQRLR